MAAEGEGGDGEGDGAMNGISGSEKVSRYVKDEETLHGRCAHAHRP